jgi:phosphoglycolate phosphatase-like HAD superfamily hydrolase
VVRVALDVDGTVLDATETAYPQASARARWMAEDDDVELVAYVTYRGESGAQRVRRLLVSEGLPDRPVRGCPPTGVTDAAGVKAELLAEVDATHYVGDAPLDCEAAERAGCAFLPADDWRRGIDLPEPRG